MGKLNEITTNLKQTDPNIKKLSDEIGTIKILMEKQITPDDILSKINEITQKQKAPLEAALKDIHSKIEPLQIDKIIDPLNKVNDQIRHITDKIDQIQPKNNDENSSQKLSPDLINTLKKLDNQLTHLNNNLPAMGDIPKQIG
jgi:Zn-dependent oligopeptidase